MRKIITTEEYENGELVKRTIEDTIDTEEVKRAKDYPLPLIPSELTIIAPSMWEYVRYWDATPTSAKETTFKPTTVCSNSGNPDKGANN